MKVLCMRLFAFTAALFVSSTAAFAADPALLNLVMPDAKILAGVNVATAKASPLGQYLLARISANGATHLQKLIDLTGFDPRTDLTEILTASSADPANPGGLVLAKGTFNVSEISAAAAQSPNVQIQTYDDDPLIVTTNPKTQVSHAVAFIGANIAVSGNLAQVKAALDRSSGTNSIDPALLAAVTTLSGANDEWVVSSVSPSALLPAKAAASNGAAGFTAALKNIQSFAGGVKFGTSDVASAQLTATDAPSANALASVLQFGVSLATMNASKGAGAAELALILQNIQVSVTGATVSVSSTVPDSEIETLLSSLKH
jgi:hypothetical protein